MNIEQISKTTYRIRQTYKGQRYSIVLDHKPTKKEAMLLMSERLQNSDVQLSSQTFNSCALGYIDAKSNVLSPSTIGGYHKILRQIDPKFKEMNIYNISQLDIQKEINRYSVGRKGKTVANLHGFISAVLGLYRPNMNINTTLPRKVKFEPYTPTTDDIRRILESSRDNVKYNICFQLGVLSLRRSEVCGLSIEDVDFDNNTILIHRVMVYDKNNNLTLKELTKTEDGRRTIYIPGSLAEAIKKQGFIIDVQPHMILKTLHDYQKKLEIPEFRFHDLRHFFASYAHANGMSDADIMATGGWKSDYTMKRVYRHAMEEEKAKKQLEIAAKLLE